MHASDYLMFANDLAQLPLTERVVDAASEALRLRLLVNAEVELDENRALPHDVLLEPDDTLEEVSVLPLGAEPEHRFDQRPVVPGAVEQHDLALGGQVIDVTLEVPLALLAFAGLVQGDHAGAPPGRAQRT